MARENVDIQDVRTNTTGDVKVQVADATTTTQLMAIDSTGRVVAKITASNGNNLTETTNALDVNVKSQTADINVDINTQTLTAVKVSKDANANAANNPIYINPVTGGTPAVVAQANPLFVELSDGANPVGTSGNPLYVDITAGNVGTVVRSRFVEANIGSDGGTDNSDYTVTALKTFTLWEVTGSSSGKARFDIVVDPTGTPVYLGSFHVTGGAFSYKFEEGLRPTAAAGLVVRVVSTNNEKNQTINTYVSTIGNEVTA